MGTKRNKALAAYAKELSKVLNVKIDYLDLNALTDLEQDGHRLAEQYCNGEVSEAEFDKRLESIKQIVWGFLGKHKEIQFNTDPRGYFLKLNDDFMRAHRDSGIETDWGGYGIICPDHLQAKIT